MEISSLVSSPSLPGASLHALCRVKTIWPTARKSPTLKPKDMAQTKSDSEALVVDLLWDMRYEVGRLRVCC